MLINRGGTYSSWSILFYILGGVGLIWTSLWLACIYELPENDESILDLERQYLVQMRQSDDRFISGNDRQIEMRSISWQPFLEHPNAIGIYFAQIGHSMGFVICLVFVPWYMQDSLNYDILNKQNYYLAFLGAGMASAVAGCMFSCYVSNVSTLRTTIHSRRQLMCLLYLGTAVCLVVMSSCDLNICYYMWLIALFLLGANSAGVSTTYLERTPDYASTFSAIGGTIGTLTIIIMYAAAVTILGDTPKMFEWKCVLWTGAGGLTLGVLLFYVLTSPSDKILYIECGTAKPNHVHKVRR